VSKPPLEIMDLRRRRTKFVSRLGHKSWPTGRLGTNDLSTSHLVSQGVYTLLFCSAGSRDISVGHPHWDRNPQLPARSFPCGETNNQSQRSWPVLSRLSRYIAHPICGGPRHGAAPGQALSVGIKIANLRFIHPRSWFNWTFPPAASIAIR
jgi:hypothetical protein